MSFKPFGQQNNDLSSPTQQLPHVARRIAQARTATRLKLQILHEHEQQIEGISETDIHKQRREQSGICTLAKNCRFGNLMHGRTEKEHLHRSQALQ